MKNKALIILMIFITTLSGCSQKTNTGESKSIASTGMGVSGPDAVIYKTKADYNMLVPVTMNEEKTKIVSFPAPGDLKYKGKPATPTVLADGFLLDNRGITSNAAFLSITYKEYMALEETPSPDDLFKLIIDKDPIIAMYKCGKRSKYTDEVRELNSLIADKEFGSFEKIK